MIGMTGEDLAKLKLGGKKKYMYDCLTEAAGKDEKADTALSVLKRLREAKTFLPSASCSGWHLTLRGIITMSGLCLRAPNAREIF